MFQKGEKNVMKSFYKGPEHLNIKKVVVIAIIAILILCGIIICIAKKISTSAKSPNTQVTETSTIFYSSDNTFSVELSNNLHLQSYQSNLSYLLELRSEDNLNIFIAREPAMENKTLSEVAEADRTAFLNNFESFSNLSNLKELSIKEHLAYTYSFHYLDKNLGTAFYLQVVWLQINDKYYIFDIEFPLNELSFYTNIVTSVLSTFQIIS